MNNPSELSFKHKRSFRLVLTEVIIIEMNEARLDTFIERFMDLFHPKHQQKHPH